ncbi:MAG: GNAT family N-acetyltransferase [Oligoflexia bacterium]|nr:GNAT family N-acetyltransferase [Oligoflexia bacterium]
MIIKSLNEIKDKENILKEIKDIFFENSTVQSFKTNETKEAFYQKWLGRYVDHFENNFLIAIEENQVLGYLCYCLDTHSFIEKFGALGGQGRFLENLNDFPAHLHMNSKVSGRGIGKSLFHEFEKRERAQVSGIHIITSPDLGNVKFYEKMDFSFKNSFELNPQTTLLFMGKSYNIK